MKKATDNIYLLWLVLALPAIWFMAERFVLHGKIPFVPWTGILSCWLLILTMAITPLQLLFGPLPWLKKRRRYFGLASFGYAFQHFFFWLINANIGAFIRSFIRPEILVGWIAFFVMIALAVTSNERSVRGMGPGWKRLQRWVYPTAAFTLAHWLMTDTAGWVTIMIYCGPLILLEIWRVLRYRNRLRGA